MRLALWKASRHSGPPPLFQWTKVTVCPCTLYFRSLPASLLEVHVPVVTLYSQSIKGESYCNASLVGKSHCIASLLWEVLLYSQSIFGSGGGNYNCIPNLLGGGGGSVYSQSTGEVSLYSQSTLGSLTVYQ